MRKIIFLALLCLFFTSAQTPQAPLIPDPGTVQFLIPVDFNYSIFDLYQATFTQPFELCIFVFADGKIFFGSNNFMERIYFPTPIDKFFAEQGEDIKNLVLVCHNHLFNLPFSPDDKNFYRTLKSYGFTGKYAIYYPHSKKTIYYADPSK
jgi:hypothetical protein